jgi:N-methylhydantoinase B
MTTVSTAPSAPHRRVALICTEGFTDVLALARQNRPDPYEQHVPPPPWGALVPPSMRLAVSGRIDSQGREVEPLGTLDITALKAMRPDAVAICLLFGHRNPQHEEAVARQVAAALPGVAIGCSYQAAQLGLTLPPGVDAPIGRPEGDHDGEFERTVATLSMLQLRLPHDIVQSRTRAAHPMVALCDAMQGKLVEAAYSSVVREAMDCAAALFLPDGRLLAQARSLPLLLGSLEPAVRGLLATYPIDSLRPGDGLLTNDPWSGGTHLPDLVLMRPVFADGQLVALLACSLHHQDIGGMAPGSLPTDARSVAQEGLRLPPLRLYQGNEADEAWLQLLAANSRQPRALLGDLAAQWAALLVGEGLLKDWLRLFSVERFGEQAEALIAQADAATRAALRTAPDGEWTASDALDGDGVSLDPVPLSVTLRKHGDRLTIDLTACADQTTGPMNSSRAATHAAVSCFAHFLGGLSLGDADQPVPNHGSLMSMTVLTRPGSVVDPTWPAPVNARTNTVKMLANLLRAAWAQAQPQQSPASNAGVAVVLVLSGTRAGTGERWQFTEIVASAAGAAPWSDGGSGVSTDVSNARNTPVEVIERQAAIRMQRVAIRSGSGGPGLHRGGDGVVREYRLIEGRGEVMYRGERHTTQAQGAAGGLPGASARARLVRADSGEVIELPAKARLPWAAGDVLIIETAGGGGWGLAGATPEPVHAPVSLSTINPPAKEAA